jgi:pyridoxine/pyridoxamine 5'-phosphate oxidase
MDKSSLHTFMADHRYGVVSSISPEGTPQSALVGIAVTDRLEIVFDTLRSTRKYRNLIARPACSVVLGFPGEKTVQLEGNVMEPYGVERTRYQEAYFSAWPDGRDRTGWPGMTYLVVSPTWIRFSDFDQRPPLIEEITI